MLGSTSFCPPFSPPTPLLGVQRSGPLQYGMPFGLQLRTAPNGFVALFANSSFTSGTIPGLLALPFGIDPTGALYLGIAPADAAGLASA